MPVRLYYCPRCRSASGTSDTCPDCQIERSDEAQNYIEKLLETVFSSDPTRVGMAIDVLADWLHEPRAIVPLQMLLQANVDVHRLVMAARGLGWLGDRAAIPALEQLLIDPTKPFVARSAAAKSLGQLGGENAGRALRLAVNDPQTSVANAARQALSEI